MRSATRHAENVPGSRLADRIRHDHTTAQSLAQPLVFYHQNIECDNFSGPSESRFAYQKSNLSVDALLVNKKLIATFLLE